MDNISTEQLNGKKYSELQKIAKGFGIKANMKQEKLLKCLIEYVEKQNAKVTPAKAKPRLSQLSGTPNVNSPHTSLKKKTPVQESSKDKVTPRPRKHSRRGTYELDTPSPHLQLDSQDDEEIQFKEVKRSSRRNTFDKTEASDMIDAMTAEMSSAERKKALLSALDHKAKAKLAEKGPTQIPRFAAFARAKKEAAEETSGNTPNWKKIHAKQFSKMESIDSYLNRKRKRNNDLSASVKKAKLLAEETRNAVKKLNSLHSPKSATNKCHEALFKSPHVGVPFVPKVSSVSKANFNFSALKSPCNSKPKSVRLVTPSPRRKSTTENSRKSLNTSISATSFTQKRKNSVTPFRPAQSKLNVSQGSAIKFDLQASLAKPLSWKPHVGKLKPLEAYKPNAHKVDVKEVKVKSRDDRRNAMKTNRQGKKDKAQLHRRGLAV